MTFPLEKPINRYMAERENIRDRIKKINPQALIVCDQIDSLMKGSVGVTITEDMTDEEAEMELYTGFIKEGYPSDIAEQKAGAWLMTMKQLNMA